MNRNKMLSLGAAVFAAGLVQGGELTRLVDPFWGCGAVRNPESQGMARGWNWEKAQTGNTHPVRSCRSAGSAPAAIRVAIRAATGVSAARAMVLRLKGSRS